jgi:hypothetical protein
MKKFLNIFFAAALILVSAQSLYAADFKFNGEYRVRGYDYNTLTGVGNGGDGSDYLDQRFLLTGNVTQGMTTGVVELQLLDTTNNGANAINQGGDILGSNGATTSNIKHGGVHQAYMNVTFPMANLMAGRRIVKLGHGIVLNETADNLALSLPLQMLSIDLAYLKLSEVDSFQASGKNTNETSGYLLNLGLKPVENWSFSAFYVDNITNVQGPADNTNVTALGITADGQAGPLGVNLEFDTFGGNAGPNSSNKGTNLLLNFSGDVAIAKIGIAYFRVTGASANSNDVSTNSIAGDFVGGHGILLNDQSRYGGGVNVNTRLVDSGAPLYTNNPLLNNNFHALKLYGVTKPTMDSEAGIEIYPLVQLVDSDVSKPVVGTTDTNVGQEFNIYGGYNIDKNLKLTGVIAYFNAGDVLKDLGGGNATNITKFNAALTYTF